VRNCSLHVYVARVSWSRVGMAVAKGAVTMTWDPENLLEEFTHRSGGPRGDERAATPEGSSAEGEVERSRS
jgi:hypothetical protein